MSYNFRILKNVYIIRSQSQPDLFKYGETRLAPNERVKSLNTTSYAGVSDWVLFDFVSTFKKKQENQLARDIQRLRCKIPGEKANEVFRVSTTQDMELLQLSMLELKSAATEGIEALTNLSSILDEYLEKLINYCMIKN